MFKVLGYGPWNIKIVLTSFEGVELPNPQQFINKTSLILGNYMRVKDFRASLIQ